MHGAVFSLFGFGLFIVFANHMVGGWLLVLLTHEQGQNKLKTKLSIVHSALYALKQIYVLGHMVWVVAILMWWHQFFCAR